MNIYPHAIVRYLERVEGIDIDDARKRLRPPAVRSHLSDAALITLLEQESPALIASARAAIEAVCRDAADVGASRLVRGGVIYAFKAGALVTVMRADQRRRKRVRLLVGRGRKGEAA